MPEIESSIASGDCEAATGPDTSSFGKRSFLKLPVPIDNDRLLAEFESIPADAWGVSHWDAHCSIDVLLLRGGAKGEASDFTTADVQDSPVLAHLPFISSLLQPEGPFGGVVYAFIFRTKPNGITRVHKDGDEVWTHTHRIHIPIITNDGAHLLAEGFAKHLPVGEAWTFDNQADHGVVNGDSTRVHMIIDVNPNPKLADLLARASLDPGRHDPALWAMTQGPSAHKNRVPPLVAASGTPLTHNEKLELGLNEQGFATRVTGLGRKAMLLRMPLKLGDIVVSVNGVETSVLSRTALDHIALKHDPGETVTLGILRKGQTREIRMHLKPKDYFSPSAQLAGLLHRIGLGEPRSNASH